jgi:hypothetical protein
MNERIFFIISQVLSLGTNAQCGRLHVVSAVIFSPFRGSSVSGSCGQVDYVPAIGLPRRWLAPSPFAYLKSLGLRIPQ